MRDGITRWAALRRMHWAALAVAAPLCFHAACGGKSKLNESGRLGGEAGEGHGGGVAGGTGEPPEALCEDPEPLYENLERCADRLVHRLTNRACESQIPRDLVIDPEAARIRPENVGCTQDTDCEEPLSYCRYEEAYFELDARSYCQQGCLVDDDCTEGRICRCDGPLGSCVSANCRTDDDCGEGLLCALFSPLNECVADHEGFYCQTPEDECRTNQDCDDVVPSVGACVVRNDRRVCETVWDPGTVCD